MPIRLHLDTRGKKLVNYYKDFRDTLEIEDSRGKTSITCWHWQFLLDTLGNTDIRNSLENAHHNFEIAAQLANEKF
jgi:hypothetical protein